MRPIHLSSIALVFIFIFLSACSKLSDKSLTGGMHPGGWLLSHGESVIPDLAQGIPLTCTSCHGEDFDGGTSIVSCKTCHLERSNACIICHGGVFDNSGAPPLSLSGDSSTIDPGVGAHTSHLAEASLSANVTCNECHFVPEYSFSDEHFGPDFHAEVIFGELADKNGGATYSFNNNTCSNTYCHGNFAGGYEANSPLWTDTGGLQDSCGSCHYVSGPNARDLGGKHKKHIERRNLDCYECHFATVDVSDTIVDLAQHIDGLSTVEFRLGGTWENQRCSDLDSGCHGGNKRWN